MDDILDIFFDDVLKGMDRNALMERGRRLELSQSVHAIIEATETTHNTSKEAMCRTLIDRIVRYHKTAKYDNDHVCPMGKHHNILFVIAKVCFDLNLDESEHVAKILDEIYSCENSFERLFVGAVFGMKLPQFFYGWKSDYVDKVQNTRALIYFIKHANKAKRTYKWYHTEMYHEDQILQIADLPLRSCEKSTLVRLAIQVHDPDLLLILLQHGANPNPADRSTSTVMDDLLGLIYFGSDNSSRLKYIFCLKLILRTVPMIKLQTHCKTCSYKCMRQSIYKRYPRMKNSNLVPPNRIGYEPPELKHICRLAIRKDMKDKFNLPEGVRKFRLPQTLIRYLDLLED